MVSSNLSSLLHGMRQNVSLAMHSTMRSPPAGSASQLYTKPTSCSLIVRSSQLQRLIFL